MERTSIRSLWQRIVAVLAAAVLVAGLLPADGLPQVQQAWADDETADETGTEGEADIDSTDTSSDTDTGDADTDTSDSTTETAATTPSATYTWNGTESNVVYSADDGTLTISGDGTLTLTVDCTVDVVVSSGTVTIDLSGYTLTNYASDTITVQSGATLTIKDTGSGTVGTVDNVTHAKAALMNYGTVTILAGTFSRSKEASTSDSDNGGNSYYVIANRGIMTIGSSETDATNDITVKFSDTCTGFYSSLIHNGAEAASAKLTIYGGSFTGGLVNVNNNTYGILCIYGGTFKASDDSSVEGTSAYYCILNWNTATISGGTFSSSGSVVSNYSSSEDGCAGSLTISGGTLTSAATKSTSLIFNSDSYGGSASVTISGGTLSTSHYAVYNYSTGSGAAVTITGGTISGTVGVFNYGENATCDISGGTVTATSYYALYNVSGATATVSGGKLSTSGSTYAVYNTATLTVSDGEISGAAGVYNYGSSASLTISGGSVTATSGYAIYNGGGGATAIEGGTVSSTSKYAIYNYTSSSSTSGSTLTISGGTVSSSGNYAIVSYGAGSVASILTISDGTVSGSTVGVYTGGSAATTTISGGTVTGSPYAVYNANSATTSISGGTFSTDVTSYLDESATITSSTTTDADGNSDTTYTVAATYVAKVTDADGSLYSITDSDGNTTNNGGYYTDLQEALSATAGSYKTVVLLQDATCSSALTIPREDTIDLGGHTLTLAAGSSADGGTVNNSVYLSTSNGQVVIENGEIVDESYSLRTFYVAANASLELEDVDITVGENVTSSAIWEESATYTSGSGDDAESVWAAPSVTLGDGASIECSCTAVTVRSATDSDNKTYAASLTVEDGAAISSSGTCIAVGGTSTTTDSDGEETTTSYAGSAVAIEGGTITTTGYRAISVYQQGDTLKISGGRISAATAEVATPYSATTLEQNATVSVTGGYFAHEVASAYVASGYVAATADLDGYGYTVSPLDVDFWGGSLYVASLTSSTATDSASLRFGFCWDGLPDGASVASFGWAWGTSESTVEAATSATVKGTNSREAGSLSTDPEGASGMVANLVLTNIGSKYYDTPIYVRMFVTYEASDGVAVTVCTDVASRDVLYVADKALSSYESGTDGYTYLSGLATAYQAKTGATSATCAHSYSS